jgi:hypothetical protein
MALLLKLTILQIDSLMTSHWARNQLQLYRHVRICHPALVPCSRSDSLQSVLAPARQVLWSDQALFGPSRRLLELKAHTSEVCDIALPYMFISNLAAIIEELKCL